MEQFLSLCRKRISVREFLPEKPKQDDIEYIQECTRWAPSAVNFQPIRIKYITQEEELKKLYSCYPREWFKSAPACYIVYKNKDEEWTRKYDQKTHGDIDTAIAIEHLCLAAAERNLGTCWVCNFNPTILNEAFPTPSNLEAIALVPIGYFNIVEDVKKSRKEWGEIKI